MMKDLIALLQRGTVQPIPGSLPAVAIPNDVRIASTVHLGDYAPTRTGIITVESLESLVAYTKRHSSDDTAIFASSTGNQIASVLDWHSNDMECEHGGFGRHQIILPLQFSDQWKAWQRINGKAIGQRELAEFIEEYLGDITNPEAAAVLETVLTISGKKSVSYKNATRLANGDTSLVWEETTDAKAGQQGDLKVPSEITVTIPVYFGCEDDTTFSIRTMFRYNIKDGQLTFMLKMLGIEHIQEMAFTAVYESLIKRLDAQSIKVPVYRGAITTTPLQTYAK